MLMRYKKVAVGGTFDRLHIGHKALLDKAFELGDMVLIGLTSDSYARETSENYSKRKKSLEAYLKGRNYEIIKLRDVYGPAGTDADIDAIVVSVETRPMALEINDIRHKRGLHSLEIITLSMILAANGRPISSTRIRGGEIDVEGRVL